MRNRTLHDALRDFALEVAALLQEEVRSGAEVAFELDEEPGSGGVLYRYRALTTEFIDARWEQLRALPGCGPAAEALGSGAASYLRLRGVPGVDAEPALRAMLDRLYTEVTSFEFPEERFETVYAEVERTLYDGTLPRIGGRLAAWAGAGARPRGARRRPGARGGRPGRGPTGGRLVRYARAQRRALRALRAGARHPHRHAAAHHGGADPLPPRAHRAASLQARRRDPRAVRLGARRRGRLAVLRIGRSRPSAAASLGPSGGTRRATSAS